MNGRLAREMLDLRPAGETRCHDDRIGIRLANGGKQPLLADQARNLIMFFLITERAGHTAAAGVEVDYFGARNPAQQAQRRLHADQCALVAMTLNENSFWSGLKTDAKWAFCEGRL